MPRLLALLLSTLPAATLAQTAPDPAQSSPLAFAQSGQRAARAVATTAEGTRVIGGEVAAPGAWPWQVALVIAGQPVSPDAQFCGGSMLLDEWVLTAAHCVHGQAPDGQWGDYNPAAIAVVVGTQTLAPGQGDVVPVRAIHVHPDYVGTVYDNDIALIRLERRPTERFATVKVPDTQLGDMLDTPGVVTYVTGWGLVEGGQQPAALRQAEIQMLDRAECNAALLDARAEEAARGFSTAVNVFGIAEDRAYELWDELRASAPPPMSPGMLCSGTYEGGRTACSGDSGGPLVAALLDGSYVQAGVVSWGLSAAGGKGCNERAPFSAYTRISSHLDWLTATIGANP